MAKEVDLLSYWMPTLRKLKEFKEIAKTEEPELTYLLEACDRTLNNMFITTADEYGISRLERMAGIFPEEGDNLETRRFNILIKWNDKVPYTDEELYNRLLSLVGKNNFKIIPHYEEYALEVITTVGIKGAFDAVSKLLEDMLPCNLVLTLENKLEAKKETPVYVAVAVSTAMSYTITNDINKEYYTHNPLVFATGISKAGTHIVTHDINSRVANETPLNEAVAVSKAFSEMITHDRGIKANLQADIKNAIGAGMAYTTIITHDIESNAKVTGNTTVGASVNTATVITTKKS